MIWGFLASTWGQRLLFAGLGAAFIGLLVALVYRAGAASAAAAAAGAVLTSVREAAKARASVDLSPKAEENDPENRDRR